MLIANNLIVNEVINIFRYVRELIADNISLISNKSLILDENDRLETVH